MEMSIYIYIYFIHLIHNIHALHFLIILIAFTFMIFIGYALIHSLLQTSYAMECIRKCERFVLLTNNGWELALSNDFQRSVFSKQSCSKFWHLHNDNQPNILHSKYLHSPPKLKVVLLFK
jgi:hypothetical protein